MKKFFLCRKLLVLIIWLIMMSCNQKPQKELIKKTVTEWIGKTIDLPNLKQYSINGKTMVFDKDAYKIVIYADSFECNSCNLKLFIWKELMGEINSENEQKVEFLFYLQPQNNDMELISLLKRDRFEYPVFMDSLNEIGKINKIPSNIRSQCFLLNKQNEVLLIGNPSNNLKIWDLYKHVINERIKSDSLRLDIP